MAIRENGEYPQGLGGAEIKVKCQPTEVAKGDIVNIQIDYRIDIIRPIDLHFDILQEPEKKWLSGNEILLNQNNGSLSINLTLPLYFDETKVLWKIFLSPHGDRFPNMLAETGIELLISNQTLNQCPYLPLESNNIINNLLDYIYIQYHDKFIYFMEDLHVIIQYSLNSHSHAIININIMDENTNEWIWGMEPIPIKKNQNKTLDIKSIFLPIINQSIYLDVSMIPVGLTWKERLAEDRTYQIYIST